MGVIGVHHDPEVSQHNAGFVSRFSGPSLTLCGYWENVDGSLVQEPTRCRPATPGLVDSALHKEGERLPFALIRHLLVHVMNFHGQGCLASTLHEEMGSTMKVRVS